MNSWEDEVLFRWGFKEVRSCLERFVERRFECRFLLSFENFAYSEWDRILNDFLVEVGRIYRLSLMAISFFDEILDIT